jgi:uncharacterized protein YcbX
VRVKEIWRYPVKSVLGEQLRAAEVSDGGIVGDRRYALFDAEDGRGLTARQVPELLFASARLGPDDRPEIVLPDGTVTADDGALSRWLGRGVELRANDVAGPILIAPTVGDYEAETGVGRGPFTGAPGPFHDERWARVSILSTASIGTWDPRRFRPNLLVEDGDDGALVDRRVQVGGAVLDVRSRIRRCVMTTRAQADGIGEDLDVLRTINRQRDGCLAVGALVSCAGLVTVGDGLHPVEDDRRSSR